MPFPYKKMNEEDFAYLRSVTAPERVWVGEEIAREYYHDEMPEYGVFPPELYVEVLDKQEVSKIMKYAWEQNIPVVVRGAGTGLAGGANCKYGGILLSVMKMNKLVCLDKANMTITVHAPDRGGGSGSGRRPLLSSGSGRKDGIHWWKCHYQCRRYACSPLWSDP